MKVFIIKNLINSLNSKEKKFLNFLFFLFIISTLLRFILFIYDNSQIIPIQGGTLKEGFIGQPIYLNPIISQNQIDLDLSSLIYSKLKDLTETYETENNFKTHIIVLKENIFWSDNNPITTDDVIFTLKLIENPELNSPLKKDFENIKYEQISKIKIKFNLNESSNLFQNKILNLTILPAHIFNKIPPQNIKLSDYNLKPISSGPYIFENFKKRKDGFIEEYNLTLNKNYQLKNFYIKKIKFKFFENENQLNQALKINEIDSFFLDPLKINDSLIKLNKNLEVKIIKNTLNYAIVLNPFNNTTLNDKNLRQALNYAINKEALIDKLFKDSIKFNKTNFESEFALPYNLELAQEKIKNFKEINITFIANENDNFALKLFEKIKEDWLKLNPLINVELVLLKDEDFKERIKNKNFEALILPIKLNEENIYQLLNPKKENYSLLNYTNKKLENALDILKMKKKEEDKEIILKEIKNLIQDDNIFIFLFKIPYYYIFNKKINNIQIEEINYPEERFLNLNEWYILKARSLK